MGIHISEAMLKVCEPISVEVKLSKFTPRQISGIVNMIERRRVRGSGMTSRIAKSLLEDNGIGYFHIGMISWRNLTESDWDSGFYEQMDTALITAHLDEEVAKQEATKSNWSKSLKEVVEHAMDTKAQKFHIPWCHDNAIAIFRKSVQLPRLNKCKEITTRLRDGSITSVFFDISN